MHGLGQHVWMAHSCVHLMHRVSAAGCTTPCRNTGAACASQWHGRHSLLNKPSTGCHVHTHNSPFLVQNSSFQSKTISAMRGILHKQPSASHKEVWYINVLHVRPRRNTCHMSWCTFHATKSGSPATMQKQWLYTASLPVTSTTTTAMSSETAWC